MYNHFIYIYIYIYIYICICFIYIYKFFNNKLYQLPFVASANNNIVVRSQDIIYLSKCNVKQFLVCITSYYVFREALKIFLSHKYINCKLYSFEIYFNCNFTLTQDYDFIEKKNNNSKPSLFLIQVNFEHL